MTAWRNGGDTVGTTGRAGGADNRNGKGDKANVEASRTIDPQPKVFWVVEISSSCFAFLSFSSSILYVGYH